MPRLIVLLLSLILGAGTAVLISCGGDDGPETGIPPTSAEGMLGELDRARAALEDGDCAEVEETATQLQGAATGALAEAGVDAEVREGIEQGAARLAELANDPSQCQQTTTEETTTEETEPTTTTPTTTEETTTTTTTEEEPEEGEDDDDGGPPPQDGGPPPPEEGGPPEDSGPPESGGTGTGGTSDGERSAEKAKSSKANKHKGKKD
jgi:hypothetical protein